MDPQNPLFSEGIFFGTFTIPNGQTDRQTNERALLVAIATENITSHTSWKTMSSSFKILTDNFTILMKSS